MSHQVEIVDVGPRDGLQNEKVVVSTESKVELIRRLVEAGVKRLEIASFVNPKRVPQMADAEEVVRQLGTPEGVTRIGLVLNEKGAERAIACGIDQLGAVVLASDEFGMRNQNQTSAESVEVAKGILALGKAAGRSVQVTISAAFGCPFSGEVDPARVVAMARELASAGPCEIALADTIGVAVPAHVADLVTVVRKEIGPIPVRAHFHDTRNTAIANVWAAVEAGASTIDASIGGLGGCPFAPRATGNVGTEDVVYLLNRSGVATGVDFAALVETSKWFGSVMGKDLPSALARAGGFPKEKDA